ncbi:MULTISPECIES: MipA/OmpV family protein [Psychrilyobacter]|uniref:MipA/OmpV family protein n=1 Tax=Psychrilyobacter piezotolerans TaxID=2293438 RepID=A0ABX9KDW6_9FUSO|nr:MULTISPECIES: MipA/OmpV family protein [Psychrilyobacter]MCS5421929.1 MipA/OmpV family protein [Psychrilyobacter sp. S5]NDI78947.1 MipA/OmpV family protein [Psychrilyobacter piezotolerans]RDE59239.1 MipA/OmpV family protein [Psychrilyobacter sp. S5]REI39799.1 MipA/OmpV family protein [Psychrilyobacter piezotolerans]
MKRIILVLFILLSVLSFSENNGSDREGESEYKFSLGFMTGYGSKLYQIEEKQSRYIPLVGLESETLYIKGTEIGYRHKLNSKLTLTGFSQLFGGIALQGAGGAIGATQLNNSDMKDGYKGINSRDTQVEFGLRLGYNTDFQKVKLIGEVRGGKRGGSGKISALRPFVVTDKLLIIPQINLSLLDKNMVDYYFGVSEDEVNDPRSTKLNEVYEPNKFAYASAIGASARYNFTPNWTVFGLAEIQYVGNEIGDSPIVDNRANYFIGLGLRYDF